MNARATTPDYTTPTSVELTVNEALCVWKMCVSAERDASDPLTRTLSQQVREKLEAADDRLPQTPVRTG